MGWGLGWPGWHWAWWLRRSGSHGLCCVSSSTIRHYSHAKEGPSIHPNLQNLDIHRIGGSLVNQKEISGWSWLFRILQLKSKVKLESQEQLWEKVRGPCYSNHGTHKICNGTLIAESCGRWRCSAKREMRELLSLVFAKGYICRHVSYLTFLVQSASFLWIKWLIWKSRPLLTEWREARI